MPGRPPMGRCGGSLSLQAEFGALHAGFGNNDSMLVYTSTVGDNVATLTAYVQEPSPELANASTRPAVLVLPGGGYFVTSDREAEPVALAYLAHGFNAFVLRYAVGPDSPFEQSFADARAALAWIRERADELHIDPTRVAVVGFSAGGHLAASLATAAPDKPDALVVGYPVTLAEFGPPVGKELLDIPSHVSPDTPPTFLFSTSDDTLVPIRNSIALLAALAEHGVPFESHIYLLGPHGISLATSATANGSAALTEPSVRPWLADSVRFLQTVFGEFALEGERETFQTVLARRQPGIDMPLGRLVADERAIPILQAHVPDVVAALTTDAFVASLSLRTVAQQRPDAVSTQTLDALEVELAALRA